MRTRPHVRRLGAATCLWLAACPRPTPGPAVDPDPTGPPPAVDDEGATEPDPCEPPGATFDDHAWAPAVVPALASIALHDPDLPPALAHLAAYARGEGHGLPIPLAFSLSQWSWQVPTLVATLGQAGLAPGELVFVAGEQADHAWVWRSTCDLDATLARMEQAWGVRARRVVEGVIASPVPPEDPEAVAFPYDVLALPGERYALVPAGRAAAVLRRFDQPAPSMGLGPPAPAPGRRLDEIAPAPIRLVVPGRALLDPSIEAVPGSPRPLRITADGVVPATPAGSDASLGDPP